MSTAENPGYNRYMCLICGYIYDEALGSPGANQLDLPRMWRA